MTLSILRRILYLKIPCIAPGQCRECITLRAFANRHRSRRQDPFVTLSAAAAVTTRLRLGTAVCLVIQRDTIQTAKLVASLDQVSKGRFQFGIGCGWNAEEMEDHGTVYETRTLKIREQIEAMKQIWANETAEYHGQIVDFPAMQTWPKPVQQSHPPVIVGGAFHLAARRAIRYGDGILPAAPSAGSGSPEEFMPRFHKMAEEAGRDPASLSGTLGGAPEDLGVLRRNRDLGVTRMTVRLPSAKKTRSCRYSIVGRS